MMQTGISKDTNVERVFKSAIHILNKVGILSRWFNLGGLTALFLMIILNFIDVILRYFFNSPIRGVVEYTEVILIAAIFLSVGYTQNEKGHIRIDILTSVLKPKAQIVLLFITDLLSVCLFSIVIWRVFEQTLWFLRTNISHSSNVPIPSAPFGAIITLGCIILGLLLLRDLLKDIIQALKNRLSWFHWFIMLGIPILIIILAVLWVQPNLWDLSLSVVGMIGIIVSLIFFFFGMPISFTLILVGFLFIGHIRGIATGFDAIGTEFYESTGSYSWSVVVAFMLMGFFVLYAKYGQDVYQAAYRWFGHLRGGLAIATIAACTGISAIVGDPVSVVATTTPVAIPEMDKYKYGKSLSAGCILGGASLGPIIPPSIGFIMYGTLSGMSIGDLFIAGIIPGILIAFCFIILIIIWCRIKPDDGPSGPRTGWRPRLASLKAGGPILVLFVVVIGGIYTGAFTPTEGGSMGACGAVIIGLVMRRFTWKNFVQSFLDGGKVISMVFIIVAGAMIFTRFIAWCNVSGTLVEFVIGLELSRYLVFAIILLIFFILGCFIDMLPLFFIGVPIFHPICVGLGLNPIWVAVLLMITINMGSFSPPFGISLFALKGMAKDTPMSAIYKGAIPFVIAELVGIIILFAIPSFSTWLPSTLK